MSAQMAFSLFLLLLAVAFAFTFIWPKQRGGDSAISATVIEKLTKEFLLSNVQIDVKTFDGVVILGGFVHEYAQSKRAIEIARGVAGVKSVDNRISILSGG